MKNMIEHMEEILRWGISGFHQYILTDPIHLCFVSRNLCEMIGFDESELLDEGEDRYAARIHPADRESYSAFLHQLGSNEQTLTVQYRLVKKNGEVLYVSDTLTSRQSKDGSLVGYSVLTDITELKNENHNLRFLNETIPCGFLKYTCEKHPQITYVNDQMLNILRLSEEQREEMDYLELCKQNIYLLIPMEERRRFSLYLNRVYRKGAPIAGELTVLRGDGTKAHLFGWVTKCVNEQGIEEFQSACMDITERHQTKKARETKRYLKALTEVYDLIFEYDLAGRMATCIFGQKSTVFKGVENISMKMEEATEKWIVEEVYSEDQEKMRKFFQAFYQKKQERSDGRPPQVEYRAMTPEGKLGRYTGIFLKIDSAVSLFCCRSIPDSAETDLLRNENVTLKENMQELMMRFTDGLVAFEVNEGLVTPLYASDNVCEFFGFTRDEWLPMMKKRTPIKEFVARSEATYEEFVELLQNGEAEFSYFDLKTETERRIKAICSRKSPEESSPRYVMLYSVDDGTKPVREEISVRKDVFIRTFGYFDVFVDDKPIAFRNKKSKELLALLVDRRGGYVSSEEAISFLWEDETANPVTLARYRKVALRLKNMLEEYGISEIVESVDGKRRIVAENVKCDLFDYLSGREEYEKLFKGSYLTNYSWGENTLAELMGNHRY